MPRKRLLEAVKPEDRAKQRQKLGTLRELTVQPTTRARYNKATDAFLAFLKTEHLELPRKKKDMDPLVCDYLEHLWASGAGRAQASDTLAGLQDLQPNLKSHLPGAWRAPAYVAHQRDTKPCPTVARACAAGDGRVGFFQRTYHFWYFPGYRVLHDASHR